MNGFRLKFVAENGEQLEEVKLDDRDLHDVDTSVRRITDLLNKCISGRGIDTYALLEYRDFEGDTVKGERDDDFFRVSEELKMFKFQILLNDRRRGDLLEDVVQLWEPREERRFGRFGRKLATEDEKEDHNDPRFGLSRRSFGSSRTRREETPRGFFGGFSSFRRHRFGRRDDDLFGEYEPRREGILGRFPEKPPREEKKEEEEGPFERRSCWRRKRNEDRKHQKGPCFPPRDADCSFGFGVFPRVEDNNETDEWFDAHTDHHQEPSPRAHEQPPSSASQEKHPKSRTSPPYVRKELKIDKETSSLKQNKPDVDLMLRSMDALFEEKSEGKRKNNEGEKGKKERDEKRERKARVAVYEESAVSSVGVFNGRRVLSKSFKLANVDAVSTGRLTLMFVCGSTGVEAADKEEISLRPGGKELLTVGLSVPSFLRGDVFGMFELRDEKGHKRGVQLLVCAHLEVDGHVSQTARFGNVVLKDANELFGDAIKPDEIGEKAEAEEGDDRGSPSSDFILLRD